MTTRTCDGLVLIVGSSPLPNLIAMLALRPKRIALICSADTRDGARRLVAMAQRQETMASVQVWDFLRKCDHQPQAGSEADCALVLRNPFRGDWIREDVAGLSALADKSGWTLFYTGGTKAMATHVYAVWELAGGRSSRACYLSDRGAKLIFDDGTEISALDRVSIPLRDIAVLHGLKELTAKDIFSGQTGSPDGYPTTADSLEVCQAVCDDPKLAERLREAVSTNYESVVDAVVESFSSDVSRNTLRARLLSEGSRKTIRPLIVAFGQKRCWKKEEPKPGWTSDLRVVLPRLNVTISQEMVRKQFEAWVKFAHGIWLEPVVAKFIQAAGASIDEASRSSFGRTTYHSVHGFLPTSGHVAKPRDFELDVAHLAGPRLYAISVTTARDGPRERSDAKLKIFEVMERARQIGGDLARTALVSLFDEPGRRGLEDEILYSWPGDVPKPRIFGMDHLRAWQYNYLSTLTDWLN